MMMYGGNKWVKGGSFLIVGALAVKNSTFHVTHHECALVTDTFLGLKPRVCQPGTHFALPWFHKVFRFDIQPQRQGFETVLTSADLNDVVEMRVVFS